MNNPDPLDGVPTDASRAKIAAHMDRARAAQRAVAASLVAGQLSDPPKRHHRGGASCGNGRSVLACRGRW